MSEEIIKTRTGGLGSSDAKMIAKIGRNGCISESDKKRIAIMLGIEEPKQFSTHATEHGNFIEECIFMHLKSKYTNAISNPYTENSLLSEAYGFKVFNHIDFEVQTDKKLIWFECKATNKDAQNTFSQYIDQLSFHSIIGSYKAKELGLEFELYLVHYFDEEKEMVFDSEKISITEVPPINNISIIDGLATISEEIKNFQYEKSDEFHVSDLPLKWQNECEQIQQILIRQKEEEVKIESFKERLKEIMSTNNVKSIKNDFFGITFVSETVSTKLDSKKLKSELPKVFEKYSKQSKVKSSIRITIK